VRTLEDCDLLVLSRDTLRPVLVRDPAAAERLTQAMAQRKAEHDQWNVPAASQVTRGGKPARGWVERPGGTGTPSGGGAPSRPLRSHEGSGAAR
jgi:hypothetical protein